MAIDPDLDADDQDQAETFDETNLTEDGEDIARPDVLRNVYDVTSAEDDAENDDFEEEDADDFDPDALDESERETLLEEDDGIDEDDGPATRDPGELVGEEDDRPADYESDAEPMDSEDEDLDRRRDTELEETFPASDAPPANPGAD